MRKVRERERIRDCQRRAERIGERERMKEEEIDETRGLNLNDRK